MVPNTAIKFQPDKSLCRNLELALVDACMSDSTEAFSMKQCINELTYDLLQRGDSIQEQMAEHPGNTVDLLQILGWTAGRKTRSGEKGMQSYHAHHCMKRFKLD